jgi:chromatin remodeling complex protein RSC6
MPTKATKDTKNSKEAKAAEEASAAKESKAGKSPKAAKVQSSKVEPVSKEGQKPNALQKLLQPSKELAAVVGGEPLPRGDVVSKVWDYIRKHDLQNPENRREILADDNLEAVFGRKKVTMFEMNKYLSQHLTSPDAK